MVAIPCLTSFLLVAALVGGIPLSHRDILPDAYAPRLAPTQPQEFAGNVPASQENSKQLPSRAVTQPYKEKRSAGQDSSSDIVMQSPLGSATSSSDRMEVDSVPPGTGDSRKSDGSNSPMEVDSRGPSSSSDVDMSRSGPASPPHSPPKHVAPAKAPAGKASKINIVAQVVNAAKNKKQPVKLAASAPGSSGAQPRPKGPPPRGA